MRVMRVQPGLHGSIEREFHAAGTRRGVRHVDDLDDGLRRELATERRQRFIGVVHRPDTERWSHYAEASRSKQFDAYVWFDETHAVDALDGPHADGVPDRHPFGV